MDEQRYQYRTGRTAPDKSHRGLVALLLMLVIFFSGIVSALSLLNIRLSLHNSSDPQRVHLAFSRTEKGAAAGLADNCEWDEQAVLLAGMTCVELSVACQELYALPAGVYVAQIAPGSAAEAIGIRAGDVLTSFAGTAVTGPDTLQQLFAAQKPGAAVELVTYRNGHQKYLTLTLTD